MTKKFKKKPAFNEDAYKVLVQEMVRAQEVMLRGVLAISDDNADMELTPSHVTGHAAASAMMAMALAGTIAGGDKEIYDEALRASVESFMGALKNASAVWADAENHHKALH